MSHDQPARRVDEGLEGRISRVFCDSGCGTGGGHLGFCCAWICSEKIADFVRAGRSADQRRRLGARETDEPLPRWWRWPMIALLAVAVGVVAVWRAVGRLGR